MNPEEPEPTAPTDGTSHPAARSMLRGPFGCVLVVVVVLFAAPFVLVTGVFARFDAVDGGRGPGDGRLVSSIDWDVMVDELEAATDGRPVLSLTLEDGAAVAKVVADRRVQTWTYDGSVWTAEADLSPGGSNGARDLDLDQVDPFVLHRLGGRAPGDRDAAGDDAMAPGTSVRIDVIDGTAGFGVTTPDSGGVPQTVRYGLDGELVED